MCVSVCRHSATCPAQTQKQTLSLASLTTGLSSRAPDLCQAAQQRGGVGGGQRGVPLRGPRRPRSHCPLEKRRLRPAQGQVIYKGRAANWPCRACFKPFLSSPDSVCLPCIQIRYSGGPHPDCAPSDLLRRGLLHVRGGEHGGEVGGVGHAHRARSVPSPAHVTRPLTADVLFLIFIDVSEVSFSSFCRRSKPSLVASQIIQTDSHLAFYPDLVFINLPQAAVPLKTPQTGRIIEGVSVCLSCNICTRIRFQTDKRVQNLAEFCRNVPLELCKACKTSVQPPQKKNNKKTDCESFLPRWQLPAPKLVARK